MPDEPVGLEEALGEEVSFEVEAAPEDDFEVVVEGTPEPERPRASQEAIEAAEANGAEDDADLPERAKKRIGALTFASRERERQLQEEQKVTESLLQYGHGAKSVIETLTREKAELQKSLREQALLARDAELSRTHNDYAAARESADIAKEVAAAQRISELTQQRAQISQFQVPDPWQPPPPPQRQAPAAITPDPVTAKWLTENRWFGEDARMRSYAVAYSQDLAKEGVAPETETFYSYINAEMRKRFPERFETGTPMNTAKPEPSAKPTASRPPVATAVRTNGAQNGKRTIVMSAEKAAEHRRAAARFGVDFKDYVKNIPKDQL